MHVIIGEPLLLKSSRHVSGKRKRGFHRSKLSMPFTDEKKPLGRSNAICSTPIFFACAIQSWAMPHGGFVMTNVASGFRTSKKFTPGRPNP
jgi:hypothetical protein